MIYDTYDLKNWGVPVAQVMPPDPDSLAAVAYHEKQLPSGEWQENADKFLRRYYLHWLEALSILKNVSERILAMLKLNKLVQVRAHCKSYAASC